MPKLTPKLFSMVWISILQVAIQASFMPSMNSSDSIHLSYSDDRSISGATISAGSFGVDEANRLAKEGVFIGKDSKDKYLDLAYGNVLLIPDKNMTLSTHSTVVEVGAGAVAFLMESPDGLVVFDLGHTQSKPVSIVFNKYKINLQPGRVLVLTGSNKKDFEKLALSYRCISCSNEQSLDLPRAALRGFIADFSFSSALLSIKPLKQLAISNNAEDRLIIHKLAQNTPALKNIASRTDKSLGSNGDNIKDAASAKQ